MNTKIISTEQPRLLTDEKIDKQAISQRFGASAASYDRGAALQRTVGNHLLNLTPAHSDILVDLGTGPGYFSSALDDRSSLLIGVDIAPSMLSFAAARNSERQIAWLAGDAEQLPFAAQCVDTIFSSLMLQWVHDLSQALTQAARVLKPNGQLCFSTLLDGTLGELATAWQMVDDKQHINRFLTEEMLVQAINNSGLKADSLEVKAHYLYYDNVLGLMRDLKAIGANQTARKNSGLMGRSALTKLQRGYEPFRTQQGLRTTYQVAYCVLRKSK